MKSDYLARNRLADVLALIQVLAIDKHAHRSEKGINEELKGPPKSSENWYTLANAHPEFFRTDEKRNHGVSLIARHVTEKEGKYRPTLSFDDTQKLMLTAIELHDREMQRSEKWKVWIPIIVAWITGAISLIGIFINNLQK